jgi:UDP-N-acetylmuramate--alanine ligase
MHVFFSGIGGSGHSGLALIAHQAGYDVSGSDLKDSGYISYLKSRGITDIYVGQTADQVATLHDKRPIDWFIYTSALPASHPELDFCLKHNIRTSKRDDFLGKLLKDKGQKLIAIAGTHGKTTTSAMAIWLFKESGVPVSYLMGGKISFGALAMLDNKSEYFIYECDEFDRNFLSFYPEMSLICGIDWDHPDIYPTRESYNEAFVEFIGQSNRTILWHDDAEKLGLDSAEGLTVLDEQDSHIDTFVKLPGRVNRQDAWLTINGLSATVHKSTDETASIMNNFPGVSRRFEQIVPNIYSDYAHTPPKIRGALQLAREVAGDNIVVIYEGLHNTRQHFIKHELGELFDGVKKLYIVPSYLAREDQSLENLTPEKLLMLLSPDTRSKAFAAELDDNLAKLIRHHSENNDLVLCFSAGAGGSLDEWLRNNFTK